MKSFWSLGKMGRLVGLALLSTAVVACGGGEDGLDGSDGQVALINTADASAEDCEFGGTVIQVGVDQNGNGELDADEITSTTLVCNGEAGSDGPSGNQGPGGSDGVDGEDGEDGQTPIVVFTDEPAGENCALGGVRVDTGFDADGDGALEGDEITDTAYVCSASCEGADLNIQFGDSDAGEVVYNFVDTVTFPVTSPAVASSVAVSVFGATDGFDFEVEYDAQEGLIVSPMGGSGDLEMIVLFTSGCGLQAKIVEIENIQTGSSTVYLAHAFPGAGEVDVNLSGTDTTVTSFDFTDVNVLSVDSRSYTFDIVVEVDEEDVVAGTTPELTFLPGETYLVYAYAGAGGALDFGVQTVDTTEPAEGNVHQRFIHLVEAVPGPVSGELTDEVNSESLFTDLSFGEASTLAPVAANPAGFPALDINGDGEADLNFFRAEGSYVEGAIIDSLIIVDGDDNAWILTIDYANEDIDLIPANIADTTIYILHAFSDAGEVDINLAGTETTITTVDFTEVSGPIVVDSGAYTFDLITNEVTALTTPELTFDGRRTYVIYAYDAGSGQLAVGLEMVDTSAPADGNAHVRGFHLAPSVGAIDGNIEDVIADTTEVAFTGLGFPDFSTFTPVTSSSSSFFGIDLDGNGTDVAVIETTGIFTDGAIVDLFVYTDGSATFGTFIDYVSENSGTGEATANLPFVFQVSNGVDPAVDHVGAFPSNTGFVSHGNNENASPGDSSYREFTVPGATTLEITLTYQIETRANVNTPCWDWLEVVDLSDDEELFRGCGGTSPFTTDTFATTTLTIPSNTFSIGVDSDSITTWAGWRLDSIVIVP